MVVTQCEQEANRERREAKKLDRDLEEQDMLGAVGNFKEEGSSEGGAEPAGDESYNQVMKQFMDSGAKFQRKVGSWPCQSLFKKALACMRTSIPSRRLTCAQTVCFAPPHPYI